MLREDKVMMSGKELPRLHVIRQAMDKTLRQREAAALLGLTVRHIRRLLNRVRAEGDAGLAHRARGKPSNQLIPAPVKAKMLAPYEQRYGDFGPTLAAQKLAERQGRTFSEETLRRWLRERGIAHFARRQRPHRTWQVRKAHAGELVQLDGSHPEWLEGRGPACVLMAYIDDASSRVYARFYEYEGTRPAMDSFRRDVRRYGIPLALYADKHTTYRSPAEPMLQEQLTRAEPQSRFGRALGELGVELIAAHSPQAKGRVERLFMTFQDRLIKEMRLAGVSSLVAANRFLGAYLPLYNRRFAVPPIQAADLHRPRPAGRDLDRIFCLQTTRVVVRRDWTVAHHGQLYQIQGNVRTTHVLVEDRVDGTMRLTHRDQALAYEALTARPARVPACPKGPRPRRPVPPTEISVA